MVKEMNFEDSVNIEKNKNTPTEDTDSLFKDDENKIKEIKDKKNEEKISINREDIKVFRDISYSHSGLKKYINIILKYNSPYFSEEDYFKYEEDNPSQFKDKKIIGKHEYYGNEYSLNIDEFIRKLSPKLEESIKKINEEFYNIPENFLNSITIKEQVYFSNTGSTEYINLIISNNLKTKIISTEEKHSDIGNIYMREYSDDKTNGIPEKILPIEDYKKEVISFYKENIEINELEDYAKKFEFPDGENLLEKLEQGYPSFPDGSNFFKYDVEKINSKMYNKKIKLGNNFYKIVFPKELCDLEYKKDIIKYVKKIFESGKFNIFEGYQKVSDIEIEDKIITIKTNIETIKIMIESNQGSEEYITTEDNFQELLNNEIINIEMKTAHGGEAFVYITTKDDIYEIKAYNESSYYGAELFIESKEFGGESLYLKSK